MFSDFYTGQFGGATGGGASFPVGSQGLLQVDSAGAPSVVAHPSFDAAVMLYDANGAAHAGPSAVTAGAGALLYSNGTSWTALAKPTGSTKILQSTTAGVLSWVAAPLLPDTGGSRALIATSGSGLIALDAFPGAPVAAVIPFQTATGFDLIEFQNPSIPLFDGMSMQAYQLVGGPVYWSDTLGQLAVGQVGESGLGVALLFDSYNWPTSDVALAATGPSGGTRYVHTFASGAAATVVYFPWPKKSRGTIIVTAEFAPSDDTLECKTVTRKYTYRKKNDGTLRLTQVGSGTTEGGTIAGTDVTLAVGGTGHTTEIMMTTSAGSAAAVNVSAEITASFILGLV